MERLHGAHAGDFNKMISGVFKPYMPLYLKLESAHMSDLVKKLIAEETWGAQPAQSEDGDDEEDEQQASLVKKSLSFGFRVLRCCLLLMMSASCAFALL